MCGPEVVENALAQFHSVGSLAIGLWDLLAMDRCAVMWKMGVGERFPLLVSQGFGDFGDFYVLLRLHVHARQIHPQEDV